MEKYSIGRIAVWNLDSVLKSRNITLPMCQDSQRYGLTDSLNGYEFEETQGDDDGQRSLACCISWGCKESDMT